MVGKESTCSEDCQVRLATTELVVLQPKRYLFLRGCGLMWLLQTRVFKAECRLVRGFIAATVSSPPAQTVGTGRVGLSHNALRWCCVWLQSPCLREKKEQKPRQTSMCSYSKLATGALCQLMRESFLKVSSEASGISYCLRQEGAPDRCSHRFGLLQQHLFFPPPSARDKLCLYAFFLLERYEHIWIWFLPLLHACCLLDYTLLSNMETGP